jgi:hypothetical protein
VKTFVTYCTRDYILHALTSLESALEMHADSKANLICVDYIQDLLHRKIKVHERIQLISLNEFPKTAKLYSEFLQSRTKFESLISIKPELILELCKSTPENEFVIYHDTDVIFFSSLDEYSGFKSYHSVYFFEHLYSSEKENYPYGKYNAGLLVLRNDILTRKFLENWSRKCNEWCFLRVENGRYADQKYLEEFINHDHVSAEICKAINLGMHYFDSGSKVRKMQHRIFIDNQALICFHFHGFKVHKRITESGLNRYGLHVRNLRRFLIIYLPALNRYFEIKQVLESQLDQSLVESIQLATDYPMEYKESRPLRKLSSGITGTYLQNSLLMKLRQIRKA